jgi:hypothetical protein
VTATVNDVPAVADAGALTVNEPRAEAGTVTEPLGLLTDVQELKTAVTVYA